MLNMIAPSSIVPSWLENLL